MLHKNWVVFTPVLLILSLVSAQAQNTSFPDVPANHWAYSATVALHEKGILIGYPKEYDNSTPAACWMSILKAMECGNEKVLRELMSEEMWADYTHLMPTRAERIDYFRIAARNFHFIEQKKSSEWRPVEYSTAGKIVSLVIPNYFVTTEQRYSFQKEKSHWKLIQEPTVPLSSRRPLVAIWCKEKGTFVGGAPYLRIAIWEDGRVLYASDPNNWSHDLKDGKISAERIAVLKKQITATGVFGLKATCCLVPDASVDCLLVDFGKQQQILYWDESESPSYGMNSNPTPPYIKFKECWKAINQFVLNNRPENSIVVAQRFRQVPRSWYVKPTLQSKWRDK